MTNYSLTVRKLAKKILLFTIHFFFFISLKKIGLFIIFGPHYSLFIIFGSLFTVHYKKSHYSLIIIPHPDPRIKELLLCLGKTTTACLVSAALLRVEFGIQNPINKLSLQRTT